ncbi:hypothetical protein KBI23_05235 [bacterium]|nr:hypothetical protein [bacterium]MBP9807932.1 hypothetical protein [bacterium]
MPAIILSVFLCFCITVMPAPVLAKENALRFDQIHGFMGRGQLTVSAKGVRLENKGKLKFNLVAKAPDWRVTIFRDDDKTYFSESLKEFQGSGLFSGFVMFLKSRYLSAARYKKSNIRFLGRDAILWIGKGQTLICLPFTSLAPEAEEIVLAAYKIPTNGCLPLECIKTQRGNDYTTGASQEGDVETILCTTKVETIEDNPKFYIAPSGYKLAKSLGVVFAGASVRHDSVEFQNLFDMKLPGGRK